MGAKRQPGVCRDQALGLDWFCHDDLARIVHGSKTCRAGRDLLPRTSSARTGPPKNERYGRTWLTLAAAWFTTEGAMKQVGVRKEMALTRETSGVALASAIAFSADLTRLAGGRVPFPKGVFRYKSHEEANEHQAACLAQSMARLAWE